MKIIGVIFIAIILSLTAFWIGGFIGHSSKKKDSSPNALISTYVLDAEVKQFDATGNLQHQLFSPSIIQQQRNPVITIEQPDVTITQNNHLWKLTGLTGFYDTQSLRFSIEGNVKIHQPDKALVVLTEQLDYDDKSRLVSSKRKVTIESPQGKITAKGLSIHLDTETIELKEKINTQYHSCLLYTSPSPRDA